jgi:uncharacterized protein YbjT (DUF2867 family)
MSDQPILVLGASGNVGSALSNRLAATGRPVRAFFDPSTPRRAAFAAGVEIVHGRFEDADALRAAAAGVAAVFLLTPPHPAQVAWQRSAVEAAQRGGAQRIVKLSAFESGADSPLHMGRWHHDGELAVRDSGLAWAIVRPQYFLQNLRPAWRRAVADGVLAGAAAPDLRLGLVDVEDVAAVAAVALTSPAHDGEVLVPTGPQALSFDDLAARIGRFAGRDIVYRQRPRDEVAAELVQRGFPDWHVEDYFAIHGTAASDLVTTTVADVTGRPARGLEDVLRREGLEEAVAPRGR